jgi:alpha-N-arabinofuranosidase
VAKIKLDLDRTLGQVDRRIFGNFIEHLGRCIYGGIYEEGSALSDENGFRQDVLEAAKGLRIPILRWPGGNFVSGYHWTDGIGPKEERPRKIELAWHTEEPNTFGTDEFIEYCRTLGTEPYICVNMGNGTMDEAQAWVEYCNGTGDTYWANKRRENGHEEPYNVRYWGLGNEMYGPWQIGALSAGDYVKKAIEFAKVMKGTDPSIELVGCGENGFGEWDRIVIDGLASYVDYHSIHIYTGSDDYWSNVLAPHQAERALKTCRALIDRARHRHGIEKPIPVAYDEWNVWFRARGAESALEEHYNLSDALAVATYLNIFVRQADTVKIANLAQMVNVIAPIFTSEDGLFLQTIYHPLRLFAEHTREVALDAHVECDTHELEAEDSSWPHRVADLNPFEVLDVSASKDGDGLTIAVVNRDPENAVEADIQLTDSAFSGEIEVYEVNGPDPTSTNSFDEQNVGVRRSSTGADGSTLSYTFPAHSLTVLKARAG